MTSRISRRCFLGSSAVALAGSFGPGHLALGKIGVSKPMTRTLGRTGFEVTTLGLGGQASIQWTPAGVDPEAIIGKSVELGVNYFDTSNVYGDSQIHFGNVFRRMNLVPGLPGYDEKKRRSICVASKTMVRHAKGSHPQVRDRSGGPPGSTAIDDLRRTLSQVFGDGEGHYSDEAYLDVFLIHNLNTVDEVDAIYHGLNAPDPKAERIGALAALRDWRDGTNLTGLNPREERRIRHLGISGHFSSPVMIECLQRDEQELIDAMLIAINANDRRYLNHQYNAIPVAAAKGVGIIAMKVFADGAMYSKPATWSRAPADVVRTVGDAGLPSRPLVEYTLTTPGISTAIIGIGHIDPDGRRCQLEQNLSAAQIEPVSLGTGDRSEIERLASKAKQGETNYFQVGQQPLGAPRELAGARIAQDGRPVVQLSWHTAYAADQPITHYEIRRDGKPLGKTTHQPQTTKEPFRFVDSMADRPAHRYEIVTVDAAGRTASSEPLAV
jgi:aryl-alcohol dehydrogenase-like predicted oxidoreductase